MPGSNRKRTSINIKAAHAGTCFPPTRPKLLLFAVVPAVPRAQITPTVIGGSSTANACARFERWLIPLMIYERFHSIRHFLGRPRASSPGTFLGKGALL